MVQGIEMKTIVTLLFMVCRTSGTQNSQDAVEVVGHPISVAAFNVQRFGISKLNKPEVMAVLVRVISQYDIVLVQEIVDQSEEAIHELTRRVSEATGRSYNVSLSPRLGRQAFEQYGFVYRSDLVRVLQERVFPDPGDVFEREPYMVTFGTDRARGLAQFTLIGIHTKPLQAGPEIDALSDVLDYADSELGASDAVVLGDFNAGCSYVTQAEWLQNRLKHRQDLVWAIADYTDTTVSASNCAYDRVVLRGADMQRAVIAGSVDVFRYDQSWTLPLELVEQVSDHYPVHFRLKPTVLRAAERHLQLRDAFTVVDRRGADAVEFTALLSAENTAGFSVEPLYDADGDLVVISVVYTSYTLSGERILDKLKNLQNAFPSLVSDYTLSLLHYKITSGALSDPSVYDPPARPRWYTQVTCRFVTALCEVQVERTTLIS